MRAAWYTRTGPAEGVLKVGEQRTPGPGPGEVLVRLHASGVNPADCNRRAGRGYTMEAPLVIPHSDGAGVVEAVGSEADARWLGRRVWLYNGQRGRPLGTAAQFIALDTGLVAELPDDVAYAEGACLGIPCMTAWCALFEDGDLSGRTVLVTGGAGAVGHYAVQLARYAGARVFASAPAGAKADQARQAGAELVVARDDPEGGSRILEATQGRGVDRVVDVDFGGNLAATMRVLADNGIVAAYASRGDERPRVPFYDLLRRNARLHALYLPTLPPALRRRAQASIVEWLRAGKRTHRVVGPFPLEETVAAHHAVERADKLGTVVVVPPQP